MCRKLVWLFCAATLCAAYATQAMAAGPAPLVYYPFDQLGGSVVDASGNGYDGTPNGGLQFDAAGYVKGCFAFNGSDSYVELDRPIQDDFSLMAWIKTDTDGLAGTQAYQGSGLFWSDVGGVANDFVVAVLGTKFSFFVGNPDTSVNSSGDIVTGEWVHVAAVRDTTAGINSIYINGVLDNTVAHSNTGPLNAQAVLAIGANTLDSRYYTGLMDEVKIFDVVLVEAQVQKAMRGSAEMASDPIPESEQVDVPRDVVLSWTAGEFAATHDVYFGTSLDDVNLASRANGLGVLVSQGQAGTTYDPEGLLAYDQTYYWRADEVNAAPDNTIFKGEVWSFTAEPLAYPIQNIIATSNTTSEPESGPEQTIDGSGLNTDDLHSTLNSDMWVGMPTGGDSPYIQYEFGRVYKLHELQVWNYNVQFELLLGFGFKDVTIEYSEDGANWTVLKAVQFAQATARANYAANTIVDLEGVGAKYVRLTANSAYGFTGQVGLSEVRFLYTPVQAREPEPADGATEVGVDAMLDWRAGREADSHDVYFGTDAEALALVDTVVGSQYNPGGLNLATTYYWQINEVNEAEAVSTWVGPLWSFSTQEFLLVDDFESYNDDDNRIYEAWIDGLDAPTNGSQVGYLDAPFAEQTIVHSGRQSMPLLYANTGSVSYSEAELTLPGAQDWTQAGVTTLTLYFYGDLENNAAQVYVKINGTKVSGGGSTVLALWKQWNIDLASTGANLRNVTSLIVGVEGSGSGTIYVDDIRLYQTAPAVVAPVDPGTADLAAHYTFENNVADVSGNGHDGTPMNDPFYEDAPGGLGRAIMFDGINDYVDLPIGSLIGSLSDMSVATWVNFDNSGGSWQRIFDFGSGTTSYIMLTPQQGTNGPMTVAIVGAGVPEKRFVAPDTLAGGWHHVAVTVDSATMTIELYLDGVVVASDTTEVLPIDLGATTQNWLGRSQWAADAYFTGSVADFSIYSRALTSGEVRYLAGDR